MEKSKQPAPVEQAEPIKQKARVEPGPLTKAAIEEAKAIYADLPMRAYTRWGQFENNTLMLDSPHSDVEGWSLQLAVALGSRSTDFATRQIAALEGAARVRGGKQGEDSAPLNAALAIVQAIAPENELETALAVQMAGCHALSCEMMTLTKSTDNPDRMVAFGNMAIKFQRTFTAQIEALARMRGKGQQTVRVEHVTVQPGGQAIVGDVHHHGRGAGASVKVEDQPHGTGKPAECTTLPRPDEIRQALPLASDAERAVPAPRRTVARRASRKPQRAEARAVER